MSVNGTLVEDKMRRFKGECAHFIFDKGLTPLFDPLKAQSDSEATVLRVYAYPI